MNQNTVSSSESVTKKYKKRSQFAEIWRRFKQNKGAMVGLFVVFVIIFIAVFADVLFDYDTQVTAMDIANRMKEPCMEHLFGTDEMGRDIFIRVLYGSRASLSVGAMATLIGLIVGMTLGCIAGYFGGAIEDVIMRATDICGSIPHILMGIAIVSALGVSTMNLILALGFTSISSFVRITRAAVLTVRNQEYVEAGRAIGQSEAKIIFSHILPNCLSPIIVQVTLRIASAIVAASSLSFLGLGVKPPSPEWGALLSAGRTYVRTKPYMTLFPGLAIMVTVLAFNLVGDGLRDALDPKLRK
ncbi:MAG: ABC transporter permease [Lachnospiraceae bacterium]|nr:ABC transporter permease [Lachnospiraceae bacterium]